MDYKCDYHVHTSHCDGKNSVEQNVLAAIDNGFLTLGFSGHGYTDFDTSFCMSKAATEQYKKDIFLAQQKYGDKIELLCGVEKDYFSNDTDSEFDYTIGSVHYIKKGSNYYAVDMSPADVETIINELFGGSFSAFAKEYYKTVANVVQKTNADIIGHFDLVTKYQNKITLKKDDDYYLAAFDAIEKLAKSGALFEINVGAIARGHRTTPYPEDVLLKHIFKNGGNIIITGDCHKSDALGLNFELAKTLAKNCGFTKRAIIKNKKVEFIKL